MECILMQALRRIPPQSGPIWHQAGHNALPGASLDFLAAGETSKSGLCGHRAQVAGSQSVLGRYSSETWPWELSASPPPCSPSSLTPPWPSSRARAPATSPTPPTAPSSSGAQTSSPTVSSSSTCSPARRELSSMLP